MKIIQAMKQIKELHIKQDDLRKKIAVFCVHRSNENPTYGDKTRETVSGWLQAHEDIGKDIIRLQTAVQRTNHLTDVTIELDGKQVTKTIAEWVLRRGSKEKPGLASYDEKAWRALTDRNLQEGFITDSQGAKVEVRLIRNYDPAARDKKVELYRSEPAAIDSTLEVVNAVTDVVMENWYQAAAAKAQGQTSLAAPVS